MTSNIEMTDEAKKACAEALSKVLADTYVLYLKTHNYHWNVEGPKFRSLHEMFEEQYRDLWSSIDDIAERIRALGHYAPGTYAKFQALSTVKDNEDIPAADDMLKELIADNGMVARTIRSALPTIQEAGDEASAGLLADRLTTHEKQLWMMKSMQAL
ncbi:Dps family protein [Chelativorans sp. AA-79]|uniref:Dps family protein n=1 Tax=Chelativorans sp. AA-79 TaxID=3028735 RepID=UPI0023F75271|nr:Dps family protein [Chelativorans sp. AA-79]WEX12122.1 DNA starvation/stationary phase protection protein [Chelativorans sp. AA-79]